MVDLNKTDLIEVECAGVECVGNACRGALRLVPGGQPSEPKRGEIYLDKDNEELYIYRVDGWHKFESTKV